MRQRKNRGRSKWKQGVLLVSAIGITLSISSFSFSKQAMREETVLVMRLPSNELFIAEDRSNPELRAFLTQEHLDQIVKTYPTHRARIAALAKWTSELFPESTPFPHYPPWNARTILDWIRHNKTHGYCAQYGIVFGQACQSLGYTVRYLDLASQHLVQSHFIAEVYLPDEHTWIAVDPTKGICFQDGTGRLMDTWDLHRVATGQSLSAVLSYPENTPVDPDYLNVFYYFRYYLRNNFLSAPVLVTLSKPEKEMLFETDRLFWADRYTDAAWQESKAMRSDNPTDFKFAFNPKPIGDWNGVNLKYIRARLNKTPPYEFQRIHLSPQLLMALITSQITRGSNQLQPL